MKLSEVKNDTIRNSLQVLTQVAKKRPLGLKRWDNILKIYEMSGTVTIPVKLDYMTFSEPFYFVFEKLDDKELLYVKPLKGEPWVEGSVYGFFGLSKMENYSGEPIVCVEGIADWGVWKSYYDYVLCMLGAKLTALQLYMLSRMTDAVWRAYDDDRAGNNISDKSKDRLQLLGLDSFRVKPTKKDWGAMYEDGFHRKHLDRLMQNTVSYIMKYEQAG